MRPLLAALVLCSVTVAAPVPKNKKPADNFEGVWKRESKSYRGKVVDFGEDEFYMTITADGSTIWHDEPTTPDKSISTGRLVIDRDKKHFDYVCDEDPQTNLPGIYELRGDTLKVCSSIRNSQVRPESVGTGPDLSLETWIRIKPTAKK